METKAKPRGRPFQKGHIVLTEWKEKLSNLYRGKQIIPNSGFKKNHIPWNKGMKSNVPSRKKGIPSNIPAWNKGISISEKISQNASLSPKEEIVKRIGLINRDKMLLKWKDPIFREKIISKLRGRVCGKISEEKRKCLRIQKIGDKNPGWKGGISYEDYTIDFNKEFKEKIRNRDQNKCRLCSISQSEHKQILDVHHINYNKKESIDNNCITLCKRCHKLTGWNRIEYETLFKEMLAGCN